MGHRPKTLEAPKLEEWQLEREGTTYTFRDIRRLSGRHESEVLQILHDSALSFPRELYCVGGYETDADELQTVKEEEGLNERDAKARVLEIDERRKTTKEFYFGHVDPITFAVFEEGRRSSRIFGAWKLWAIRLLPGSTDRDTRVSCQPFPGFPNVDRRKDYTDIVTDLMIWHLKQPPQLRLDGGTFKIDRFSIDHYSDPRAKGASYMDVFKESFTSRGAKAGLSVSHVIDPTNAFRSRWSLK